MLLIFAQPPAQVVIIAVPETNPIFGAKKKDEADDDSRSTIPGGGRVPGK